jgi:hypothetical protein
VVLVVGRADCKATLHRGAAELSSEDIKMVLSASILASQRLSGEKKGAVRT